MTIPLWEQLGIFTQTHYYTTFFMKHLFLFLALALFGSTLSAQKITGSILQSDGTAAAFATVLLQHAKDTTLAKGAISDETGKFEFYQMTPGSYFIQSNLVGSGKGTSLVFTYDGTDLSLEPVRFKENAQELAQVTVVARKPIVEVKADKTILNVEGNINSQGQNALELLRKAPGVVVDNNDNINLKGKNSVRFQIDGRDQPLESKEVINLLKNMRAEDIAAIEMITNPSAKYDASGNAGIINFRTRKNKGYGTNGSIGLEGVYGKTPKGGGSLSLNHRNKHINVYGNYSNHFGDWQNELRLTRDQYVPIANETSVLKRYDQSSVMIDRNKNHNFKVGADIFLNDKHSLGFIVDSRLAGGSWINDARTPISDFDNGQFILKSILVAGNTQDQKRNNTNFNINYRFADTLGHELNIDANRGYYRAETKSYQPNIYKNPSESETISENIYRSDTPTDIDITIVKADYEQNFLKGKLGIGAKMNLVTTDNTFDFFNVYGSVSQIDTNRSNQFAYSEMVNAAYINYNRQWKKWGLQTGLRAEHTDWKGDLNSLKVNGDEMQSNKYLSWFPSAALTYTVNEKNQLNLTYSRRIDRPSYRDLNPFEDRLDELTFKKGNPFLRPQFTNSLELTHTFMQFINTTFGYSHTNDVFTEYIDTAAMGATFLRQGNIAEQDNYSLSIGAPLPIAKWWEGYLSLTGVISSFSANFRENYTYSESFKSFNLYSEQNFRLPKGWSFQVSGWYNSPAIWQAVFRAKSMGSLDIGVKKQLFDGNGTLSLSMGDLLRTAGWRSVNDFTPGLYMTGDGRWESQAVRLNFNYRFGSNTIKGARQRKTGLEDVNARIKK